MGDDASMTFFFDGDSKTAAAPRTAATLADRLFCTVVLLMAPIRRVVGIFSCQMISDGWMNLSWRRRLEYVSEPDGKKKITK